jgi:hypothetical protein
MPSLARQSIPTHGRCSRRDGNHRLRIADCGLRIAPTHPGIVPVPVPVPVPDWGVPRCAQGAPGFAHGYAVTRRAYGLLGYHRVGGVLRGLETHFPGSDSGSGSGTPLGGRGDLIT